MPRRGFTLNWHTCYEWQSEEKVGALIDSLNYWTHVHAHRTTFFVSNSIAHDYFDDCTQLVYDLLLRLNLICKNYIKKTPYECFIF